MRQPSRHTWADRKTETGIQIELDKHITAYQEKKEMPKMKQ